MGTTIIQTASGNVRLTAKEARCLQFAAEQTPDNRTMAVHFGLGMAYHLGRRGLLSSDSRNWTITIKGRDILEGSTHDS